MKLTSSQKQFIREHMADDLSCLLLSASKYPRMDIPFLADQIAARRQIKEKLPSWYVNPELIFPARIAAEQCSSEQTAAYKQQLVLSGWHVCDLTGGLGIDSYYFSRKVKQLTYIERFPSYCKAARHNFAVLEATNIKVVNADTLDLLDKLPSVDAFYIDPARRGESNKRVFALQNCEPNLPALLPVLVKRAQYVIAKISPMADIRQVLEQLPGTIAVHVLSVRNECKELLFVIRDYIENSGEPAIYCINIAADGTSSFFSFTLAIEQATDLIMAKAVDAYLYEPNASILKAGAFKQIAINTGTRKLHVSSHLYTSNKWIPNFPGRSFKVDLVQPFSGRLCKTIAKSLPQANITIRNFPLSVEKLRERTNIQDGGEIYLFATTLSDGEKVLIRCRKI